MLTFLTAKQWSGWIAFNEAEPMGEWRQDARALSLWQRIGMAFGGEKPDEIHLPCYPYVRPRQDGEAIYERITAIRAEEEASRRAGS